MARQTFALEVSTPCTSATSQDLLSPNLPDGNIICIDRLVAVDRDHTLTRIDFGVKAADREYLLGTKIPTLAAEAVYVRGKVWLLGRVRPFGRFVGATKGDNLSLYIYGYTVSGPYPVEE